MAAALAAVVPLEARNHRGRLLHGAAEWKGEGGGALWEQTCTAKRARGPFFFSGDSRTSEVGGGQAGWRTKTQAVMMVRYRARLIGAAQAHGRPVARARPAHTGEAELTRSGLADGGRRRGARSRSRLVLGGVGVGGGGAARPPLPGEVGAAALRRSWAWLTNPSHNDASLAKP